MISINFSSLSASQCKNSINICTAFFGALKTFDWFLQYAQKYATHKSIELIWERAAAATEVPALPLPLTLSAA